MDIYKAKLVLLCIAVVSIIMCIPTIFVYGPMDISVAMGNKVVLTAICRYDEKYKGSGLQQATSYSLLLAFSIVLLTTIILYLRVANGIRKFERRKSGRGDQPNELEIELVDQRHQPALRTKKISTPIGPVNGRPVTRRPLTFPNYDHQEVKLQDGRLLNPTPYEAAAVKTRTKLLRGAGAEEGGHAPSPAHAKANDNARNAAKENPNANATANPNNKQPSFKRKTRTSSANQNRNSARGSIFSMPAGNMISAKMFRVFAIITAVFIVSYLPHLVVLILTKALDIDSKVLTHGQRFLLELAYNCPYISTLANPLVYGFSSSEFRDQLRELLVHCECRSRCCCYCCCEDSHRRPSRRRKEIFPF